MNSTNGTTVNTSSNNIGINRSFAHSFGNSSVEGGKRMGKQMGKRMRTRMTTKTGIRGRGRYLKGWSTSQPGYHERTVMMANCGKKCFLGPRRTFPICNRNTCKINRKGVYAAYIRANEYKTIRSKMGKSSSKYRRISAKARKLLYMGGNIN